jgi:nucleoside-diphosphate-sugar epimerase
MKVFVSGATGFLGESLLQSVIAQGSTVRALVQPTIDSRPLVEIGATVIRGDVRDLEAVREALGGCDLAYHLAALVPGPARSIEDYHAVNVRGTENVLRACVESGVRHLVYCSTVSVHGLPGRGPAHEGSPLRPLNAYGATKLLAEQAVARTARQHGLSTVIVRPTALYGPGDVRNVRLFRDIARRRLVMIGRGQPRCHLAYRDDVTAALQLAGARRQAPAECFIVGGSEQPSVEELLRLIAAETGVPLRALRLPRLPFVLATKLKRAFGDPARTLPGWVDRFDFFTADRFYDTSRAARELGFRPQVSLREGIRRTVGWYRRRNLL